MTEEEWLACDDPARLCAVVQHLWFRGRARKLRLFAVAACRRFWSAFRNEDCRKVIEMVERYADGCGGGSSLKVARNLAAKVPTLIARGRFDHLATAVRCIVYFDANWASARAAEDCLRYARDNSVETSDTERLAQCAI